MERESRSELDRLSQEEQRLVQNYRRVNETRQDTLLYFSDELVKLESEDRTPPPPNVVQIHRPK